MERSVVCGGVGCGSINGRVLGNRFTISALVVPFVALTIVFHVAPVSAEPIRSTFPSDSDLENDVRGGSGWRRTNNDNHKGRKLQPPTTISALRDGELILDADLWSDQPEILSALPAFDGILALGGTGTVPKQVALDAGGTWIDSPDCIGLNDTTTPPGFGRAQTSAQSNSITGLFDCASMPFQVDAMPVCFSWPVLPSSVRRDYFEIQLSNGVDFTPNCISSFPNFEYNERHCVVLLDELFNRAPLDDPDRLYMESIVIVGDLMLVGPNGQLTSAMGLSFSPPTNISTYSTTGPSILAARLQLASVSSFGEGGTQSQSQVSAVSLPNAVESLYTAGSQQSLFRLRLFFDQGVTPNGVTGLRPDKFDDYFSIVLSTGDVISASNEPMVVGTIGSIEVVGLADLGPEMEVYDDCYPDDRDNYVDIAILVEGDDIAAVVTTVEAIVAFHKGNVLYNPGGPGETPTPGVQYTAPTAPDQVVPITVDYEAGTGVATGTTSYCVNMAGENSTDRMTCATWRFNNDIFELPYGSIPSSNFTTSAVESCDTSEIVLQIWNVGTNQTSGTLDTAGGTDQIRQCDYLIRGLSIEAILPETCQMVPFEFILKDDPTSEARLHYKIDDAAPYLMGDETEPPSSTIDAVEQLNIPGTYTLEYGPTVVENKPTIQIEVVACDSAFLWGKVPFWLTAKKQSGIILWP